VALTVTCPKPFVGDRVTFGPANNCVTPPFKAYEALTAFWTKDAVNAYDALKAGLVDVNTEPEI